MPKNHDPRQLCLGSPLGHIVQAIAREIQLLGKYERSQHSERLHEAREIVREVDEKLAALRERRAKRTKK